MTCECTPGYNLCSVAVGLWSAVGKAYDIYKQTGKPGDWAVYEVARVAYNSHLPQGGNT